MSALILYNTAFFFFVLGMATIITDIDLAAHQLIRGDIVAIPTETVYGLAGNASDEAAIAKIYQLKNRPLNHPLIVHVASDSDLLEWVSYIPPYAYKLMEKFWPGPLTLVFSVRPGKISPSVTGGQSTVAIRCPAHPIAQTLLHSLNFPLVAPSANPFGKISPTTAEHVQDSFHNDSLLILDGGRATVGIESTIIDATHPESYQLLRAGIINEETLDTFLNAKALSLENETRVSGRLKQHYQPEKTLFYFDNQYSLKQFIQNQSQSVYALCFEKLSLPAIHASYQLPADASELAYELYFQLRRADKSEAVVIAIELPPDTVEWQGIRERIIKAGRPGT
ncbi:SUA5/yciO/yrdC family transporter:Sua5/YciO/YrdC/YwlC family transporter protein [Legionella quinlivanii]|uniref:Threonylcarbamoyl-AMP synthase n=2 Tax=Legionella quinlivanii TaxID=45073 RepID=A0A0W0XRQ4_9GAMM|nr:SUA5/yciO/yrdC family transporter:Sua5/YciO/YrdC/YwlC family transporter protein [Legionella quinlivanii]SEG38250.1 L-threonylcarbamoyladenylate synthase [Legionella quinlivanii DSM 21216]STY10032.1 putative translation factor [Legionella quinlivanii]